MPPISHVEVRGGLAWPLFVSIRVHFRGWLFICVNLRPSAVRVLIRVLSRSKKGCKVYLIDKDTNLGYFEADPTPQISGGNTDESVIPYTPLGAWKRES
jgi:hypothetical protein